MMLDFVQQLVNLRSAALRRSLGFVLVYKATEVVNFAQGDLMMLGGFFAFTFIGMLGLNYWLGFAGAVAAMALFGMLAERVVVRPILGYPQFSIIMATIGLGYFLRSIAGIIWGTDDLKIETPFSQGVLRIGLSAGLHKLSVIAATVILCVVYLFQRTTPAPRCAPFREYAAYYMAFRSAGGFDVWAISAAVAATAGVLLAPITFIHSNVGLALGLKAFPAAVLGGFGSIPGAVIGGLIIGVIETLAGFYLPQGWKDVAPYIVFGGTAAQTRRPVRPYAKKSLMRFLFKTDYEDDIRLFPHSGFHRFLWCCWLTGALFVLSSYSSASWFRLHLRHRRCRIDDLTDSLARHRSATPRAIDAYTAGFQQFNVPFPVYFLARAVDRCGRALVGFRRCAAGHLSVIATIFAFIVEEVLARWKA
jgi:branched-chain amino acid transport system permease protein